MTKPLSESRVIIFGAGGMLGQELVQEMHRIGASVISIENDSEVDICSQEQVSATFDQHQPDIVINAAGYTDVDGAEKQEELALAVNGTAPGYLANACAKHEAQLVHYSTDYVFDGTSSDPVGEEHPTNPVGAYGRSKLAGEETIRASGCSFLMIRTSWLFAAHSRNFVKTIRRVAQSRHELQVVSDQIGRPTYAPDLANWTGRLLETQATGTVHASNDGQCSWFDFACTVVQQSGLECQVIPCTTEEFPRPARRPAYSVLNISRLQGLIGPVRDWNPALAECINLIDIAEAQHTESHGAS